MSSVNTGGQVIGWKYSTPLKADELNTFHAGMCNPGLLTRPYFQQGNATVNSVDINIYPFAMLVVPYDKYNTYQDENGNKPILRLVKITTTSLLPLTVASNDVAIGFRYSFVNDETKIAQPQWYGEFITLDFDALQTFKHDPDNNGNPQGIIIATVQTYRNENQMFYSITSSGADISDALLRDEGWDPNCWLSVRHPFRLTNSQDAYNILEVRKHNDVYESYMNGNSGLVRLSAANMVYELDKTLEPFEGSDVNKNGTRGFMPYNWCCFSLQSGGFRLSDHSNTSPLQSPIEHTHGGIFAVVDATNTNYGNIGAAGMGGDSKSFTNTLKIIPVQKEDINIYYNDNTLVIN